MRKWKPYGNLRDPGVWLTCTNAYPTSSGSYRCAPSFAAYGTAAAGPATPGTTLSAWTGQIVSGTAVAYVGTTTKLYEITAISSGTFTDRSKGGGYTNTATQWCFCQFGNITIATNYVDAVQSRDSSGVAAFADLAGSPPKARICLTQSNAVLLFNYNDGTAYGDGWWASDIGDHTTWTPASSNDAANGRILSRPGPITAAVAFRDEVIVFKSDSVHRMRYVGAPFYWTVDLVADGIGAAYQGSVINCGRFLIFGGVSGVYIYDGAQFRNISEGFQTTAGNTFQSLGEKMQTGLWFGQTGHAVFFTNNSDIYVYNIHADAWGKFLPFNTSGTRLYIYSDGDNKVVPILGTPAALTALASYSALGTRGILLVGLDINPCVMVDSSLNAADFTMTLGTHVYGDEQSITNIGYVRPVWAESDGADWTHDSTASSYTCTINTKDLPHVAGTNQTAASVSAVSKRFDVNFSARYLTALISATAHCEIEDVIVKQTKQGTD